MSKPILTTAQVRDKIITDQKETLEQGLQFLARVIAQYRTGAGEIETLPSPSKLELAMSLPGPNGTDFRGSFPSHDYMRKANLEVEIEAASDSAHRLMTKWFAPFGLGSYSLSRNPDGSKVRVVSSLDFSMGRRSQDASAVKISGDIALERDSRWYAVAKPDKNLLTYTWKNGSFSGWKGDEKMRDKLAPFASTDLWEEDGQGFVANTGLMLATLPFAHVIAVADSIKTAIDQHGAANIGQYLLRFKR